jgi:hypothetical protein
MRPSRGVILCDLIAEKKSKEYETFARVASFYVTYSEVPSPIFRSSVKNGVSFVKWILFSFLKYIYLLFF